MLTMNELATKALIEHIVDFEKELDWKVRNTEQTADDTKYRMGSLTMIRNVKEFMRGLLLETEGVDPFEE